jgi:N-acetyl-alpha-D-muramate 1-phosphate uridylyltransferase
VIYGDSYLPIDYGPVWDAYAASGRPALMTVFHNTDVGDTSNATLGAGGRVRYRKGAGASSGMTYIDYGLLVLSRHLVVERMPAGLVGDLADLLTDLGERGDLAGFEVDRPFYEIGSEVGIANLEALLRAGA